MPDRRVPAPIVRRNIARNDPPVHPTGEPNRSPSRLLRRQGPPRRRDGTGRWPAPPPSQGRCRRSLVSGSRRSARGIGAAETRPPLRTAKRRLGGVGQPYRIPAKPGWSSRARRASANPWERMIDWWSPSITRTIACPTPAHSSGSAPLRKGVSDSVWSARQTCRGDASLGRVKSRISRWQSTNGRICRA